MGCPDELIFIGAALYLCMKLEKTGKIEKKLCGTVVNCRNLWYDKNCSAEGSMRICRGNKVTRVELIPCVTCQLNVEFILLFIGG
jgi:hypothetical protein